MPDGVQNRCRPSIRLTRRLRPGLTVSGGMSVSDALSLGTVLEGASVEASEDNHTVTLTIPLSQGQSLLAEYRLSDGQLISSRIFNSEDYAIDTRLPVWTGPEGAETTAE